MLFRSGKKRSDTEIEASFKASKASCQFEIFNGECSRKEINRIAAVVKGAGCDIVVGIGGGKIFDTAKSVANQAGISVVICPTIAATDAPCSALSVIYGIYYD